MKGLTILTQQLYAKRWGILEVFLGVTVFYGIFKITMTPISHTFTATVQQFHFHPVVTIISNTTMNIAKDHMKMFFWSVQV